ncbi:histidine kinase-like protein [Streptomyces sp. TLI_55]|nr:histidine kinase-like protein [Streptomyces sp. TLI_55]
MIPSAPLGTDAAAGPHSLGAASGAGRSAGPAAERRFRFELAAHPGSAAQARRLTRARLNGWAVCEDTCDTAALVVSELVTNAIVHTASRHIVCELHDGDDLVRIAVRDEGCAPGEPHPCAPRGEEEHGRGLLLVDALCHSWGTHEHGPGLLVWADLPRESDTAGTDTGPHNDLGWGARPKPGPAGGSGGEDDEADALHKADARYDTDAHHHAIPGPGTAAGHSDAIPDHRVGPPRPEGSRAARHDATPRHDAPTRHDGTPRHTANEPWPPGAETWHLGRPRRDGSEAPHLHYGAPWHDGTEVRYDGAEARHHGTSRHHGSAPHHGTGGPWL